MRYIFFSLLIFYSLSANSQTADQIIAQLVNKINKKGMDINEYLGCIKNIEEIEVDDNFLINEELRKKSVDVRNYVLYLILNNGIRLELILSSYDDFKHWLNALTSIVKHKNKLSLISNKIEQENNIYF